MATGSIERSGTRPILFLDNISIQQLVNRLRFYIGYCPLPDIYDRNRTALLLLRGNKGCMLFASISCRPIPVHACSVSLYSQQHVLPVTQILPQDTASRLFRCHLSLNNISTESVCHTLSFTFTRTPGSHVFQLLNDKSTKRSVLINSGNLTIAW